MDLNTIWFVLVAVLLSGYAILDGFDLGVGILSLFARSDEEKRVWLPTYGSEAYPALAAGLPGWLTALLIGVAFMVVAWRLPLKMQPPGSGHSPTRRHPGTRTANTAG